MFLALSPITATILGALLLNEDVSIAALAGLVLVVAGLWLAHRSPGPQAMEAMASEPIRQTRKEIR